MRILTIIGARPQFIKAAAVSRRFKATSYCEEILLHTGQHYDTNMSQLFFDELEIPHPKYNLEIGSGSHGKQTGEMLVKIEEIIIDEKPDWVLIYGDTNSTLAGALAAAKLHVPVAHIEAGLRSFNKKMAEEINRIIADQLSKLLFVPTKQAMLNLKNEGFAKDRVHLTGDVMFDAALYFGKKAETQSQILNKLSIKPKTYILSTVHRAENTDDPNRMDAVFSNLIEIAKEIPVILPWLLIQRDADQLIPALFQLAFLVFLVA